MNDNHNDRGNDKGHVNDNDRGNDSSNSDNADARHVRAMQFAAAFLARGLEFAVIGGRLRLWPWKPVAAYRYLDGAELVFISEHRAELKEIAISKVLGETQVIWTPPSDAVKTMNGESLIKDPVRDVRPAPITAASASTGSSCPYCGDRKCVGRDDKRYRIFHWMDPEQVATRRIEASAEMRHQVNR